MPTDAGYTLLDFGGGRKLERFGRFVLNRPSPPAEGFRKSLGPAHWNAADAMFEREAGLRGKWRFRTKFPPAWQVNFEHFLLELKPTDVGHLGVFAEQAENWQWIFERSQECLKRRASLRVLNLFSYTGGSTLAAAAALAKTAEIPPEQAYITHVDAAKNVVQWARRNAEISGIAAAPVRWIAEDALKFTQREARRGRMYDAVILDPPSYGHGGGAEVWKIERDLPRLLKCCAEITRGVPAFFLLTAHSEEFPRARLESVLREFFPEAGKIVTDGMSLHTADGRTLPSGEMARFSA